MTLREELDLNIRVMHIIHGLRGAKDVNIDVVYANLCKIAKKQEKPKLRIIKD